MTMTEAVAARLNDILKDRQMSRRQLAEACNLPVETIGSIFKKLAKSVTLSTLGSLCYGLGMLMSEFLDCEYFRGETLASDGSGTSTVVKDMSDDSGEINR